ncbi:MAG TPA: winged helix-turn-helix domain-containing protein [Candidatus Thermoplasmatota archaeon]|nr:winged helix-turn-helix domain-containing protein [Candidatus Thermoplasmatota archaeon]
MDRITLDRAVFKALASDTRLDILKALDERQKTVTELARELDLNKATVFEHLEKLAEVGLIQKLEDDRKWVYWQLTWTGRRLLHPEAITLALVLSSAAGSLLTALAAAWLWYTSNVAPPAADATSMRAFEAAADAAPPAPPPVQHDPLLLAATVGFAVVFVALLLFAARVWRSARGSDASA